MVIAHLSTFPYAFRGFFTKLQETLQSFDHDLTLMTRCRLCQSAGALTMEAPADPSSVGAFSFSVAANADPLHQRR